MEPFLDIVIPTYNRADHLAVLLESLAVVNDKAGIAGVYVVENGSAVARELTESFADRLPVHYRHFAEGNKSKALNGVLTELEPDRLTLNLDDDVLVTADVVALYRKAVEQFGPGHCFGGPVTVRYEEAPEAELIPFMPVSNRGFSLPHAVATGVADQSFLGCNWAAYPADVVCAGSYRENLGPGAVGGARGQETDMQFRLYGIGIKPVYVPGTVVSHWVPARFIRREWIMDRLEKSKIYQGAVTGTPIKYAYWGAKALLYGALQGVNVKFAGRYAAYKGLFAGRAYRSSK